MFLSITVVILKGVSRVADTKFVAKCSNDMHSFFTAFCAIHAISKYLILARSDHSSSQNFKVTGTCIYLEITVTRFMQPMPILTPTSTKLFLGSNPFRPTHIL